MCGFPNGTHDAIEKLSGIPMNTYDANGIRLKFPAGWKLDENRDDGQFTLTIQSPGTSFWSVTVFDQRQDGQHIIDQVFDTLREEYDQIDVYDAPPRTGSMSGLSYDAEFVCYELVNGAFLRFVDSESQDLLIYYQGTDHELEETKLVLEAITLSLEYRVGESEWDLLTE